MARQPQNGESPGFGDSLWRILPGIDGRQRVQTPRSRPGRLKCTDYSLGERRWLGETGVGRPRTTSPLVVAGATAHPGAPHHGEKVAHRRGPQLLQAHVVVVRAGSVSCAKTAQLS